MIKLEHRPADHSLIISEGTAAIMLTPTADGLILTPADRRMHPFDTIPVLFSNEAVALIADELRAFAAGEAEWDRPNSV